MSLFSVIKKIIRYHIEDGINIITYGWWIYNWLNVRNSGYNRIIHFQGRHDLGFGSESISHVESIWSDLKWLLNKFYVKIQSKNLYIMLKNANGGKKLLP